MSQKNEQKSKSKRKKHFCEVDGCEYSDHRLKSVQNHHQKKHSGNYEKRATKSNAERSRDSRKKKKDEFNALKELLKDSGVISKK